MQLWPGQPDEARPIRVIVRWPGSRRKSSASKASSTSPDGSSRSREIFPRCSSNSPRTARVTLTTEREWATRVLERLLEGIYEFPNDRNDVQGEFLEGGEGLLTS
jgi:hypothetical protein